MTLALVGISHHRAPIEVRERVALSADEERAVAARVADSGVEAVCLSTCNRTELYVAGGEVPDDLFAERGGGEIVGSLYRLHDEAAARHLFRVAAGLDSLVPGEAEILGQVRASYERGVTGPVLDRLFRQALHVGRKVRAQTAIGESPASVAGAAGAFAQQLFGDLTGRRIVLIGAGKVGEQAARNLLSRGAEIALAANSKVARDELITQLETADVVVSSTSAPDVVLRREDVERILPSRKGRPLFLIDLAVPRDLDPEIHELAGCYVYDIDDLQSVVEASLAGRRSEAELAETLVATEADRFREWLVARDVVPAIASLRARAEQIRASELAKAESRLARLSDAERRAVEAVTAQIVNKLLHLPTVRLKEAAAGAEGVGYAAAVRHLFGLEDER